MTKLIFTALFLLTFSGCDDSKNEDKPPIVCLANTQNELQILSSPIVPIKVVLYATELTSDSCYEQIIDEVQELNSKPEDLNKNICYYPLWTSYSLRDLEQRFFTDKESLTNEEMESHIKNVCSANYKGPPIQEFISIELKEGQFNFTYEFMGEFYEGQITTFESDEFTCPIFRAECLVNREGETTID